MVGTDTVVTFRCMQVLYFAILIVIQSSVLMLNVIPFGATLYSMHICSNSFGAVRRFHCPMNHP